MALSNTGITTSLVGNTLGTSSRNVGALCTNSDINCWSKWKPISTNVQQLTLDGLKNKNYGITILSGNTPTTVYNQVVANSNLGYTYNKPIGGSNSPYRLGDFRNYEHSAILPIDTTYVDNEIVNIGGVTSTNHPSYEKILMGLEVGDSPIPDKVYYLSKGDIYNAKDINGNKIELKRGALVTDGTNSYWSTTYIPWWHTNWQKFSGKSVKVFEFLTNTTNTPNNVYQSNMNDLFLALPEPICSISVKNNTPAGSKDVFCGLAGEFANSGKDLTRVNYDVYFNAIGDAYRGGTITNVTVSLSKDIKGLNPIANIKIANSITVNKGTTTQHWNGTMSNLQSTPNLYLLVYWNNTIQQTTMVLQSMIGA